MAPYMSAAAIFNHCSPYMSAAAVFNVSGVNSQPLDMGFVKTCLIWAIIWFSSLKTVITLPGLHRPEQPR